MDGCWADICKMDSPKQELFLERILFLHQLAVSRTTSSSQSVRLPLGQWEKEIEICCTAGYVLKSMAEHVDPDLLNTRVFSDEMIKQVKNRVIEGKLFLQLVLTSFVFLMLFWVVFHQKKYLHVFLPVG